MLFFVLKQTRLTQPTTTLNIYNIFIDVFIKLYEKKIIKIKNKNNIKPFFLNIYIYLTNF